VTGVADSVRHRTGTSMPINHSTPEAKLRCTATLREVPRRDGAFDKGPSADVAFPTPRHSVKEGATCVICHVDKMYV
jgi:hypothetical protein